MVCVLIEYSPVRIYQNLALPLDFVDHCGKCGDFRISLRPAKRKREETKTREVNFRIKAKQLCLHGT